MSQVLYVPDCLENLRFGETLHRSSNQQPVVDCATVRMENRCRIAADGLLRFDAVGKGDDEKQRQSYRGSVW